MSRPFISVIVPVRNGGVAFARCLDALTPSCGDDCELVVADDASTDGSGEVARGRGAKVVRLERQSGPAAARNAAARAARGSVLFFVDADVEVRAETIARVASLMRDDRAVAAVFGSYDDAPAASGLVSQYKNLLHHFVHQHARREASTFWAGCGAVRREAFERVGGFDGRRYARPSIEDIELGYRLRQAGFRIVLEKELQVKHLKRWTFLSLLRADVRDRALPWSRLILESGELPDDLNLRGRERLCAVLACASLVALVAAPTAYLLPARFASASSALWLLALAVLLVASVFVLNRGLYAFFRRQRGARFLAGAFALHLLYYVYGSATFAACWLAHAARLGRRRTRAVAANGGAEASFR
jgi:GT2 family glycosyltransferase